MTAEELRKIAERVSEVWFMEVIDQGAESGLYKTVEDVNPATVTKLLDIINDLQGALDDIYHHAMNSRGYKPDRVIVDNCELWSKEALTKSKLDMGNL